MAYRGVLSRWGFNINRENLKLITRNFTNAKRTTQNTSKIYTKYGLLIGGSAATLAMLGFIKSKKINALNFKKKTRNENESIAKLTPRERRFIKFASVEYNEQLYMTPQDFLDSVVEQEPRPRLKRKVLSAADIAKYKDNTPPFKKGSTKLFRNMRDKGVISYTEYLFLLSILTKPKSGFRVAFNMFDTDGNQRVDRNEYLVIISILAGTFKNYKIDDESRQILSRLVSREEREFQLPIHEIRERYTKSGGLMERIFSGAWKEKRGKDSVQAETDKEDAANTNADTASYVDDQEGLQRRHLVDTTLQTHFFGKRGNDVINYDGFYKFMDNLQTEVLELEFHEFSKGNNVISEVDFAKILLRYTYLATEEYYVFLERLLERVKDDRGITFQDFRDFCRFLNNLDDFIIAMRMYTLADRAISQDEFSRAVKICTGFDLSKHLIETVFAIFDEDGDGLLSYQEFIAIMKDRLHRGLKVSEPFLEYNTERLNDYDEPPALFALWRYRVCRHLDHYKDGDNIF